MQSDAPVLRTDKEGKTDNHIWHWETGDKDSTEKAFQNADVVVKENVYLPRIHVASIETCGCVASFEPAEGKLTVYMTTQAPHAIRTVVALVAGHVGLSEEKSALFPLTSVVVLGEGPSVSWLRDCDCCLCGNRKACQMGRGSI